MAEAWHVVVPIADDATSVWLLVKVAAARMGPLWWVSAAALSAAGLERAWLVLTLCAVLALMPLLGIVRIVLAALAWCARLCTFPPGTLCCLCVLGCCWRCLNFSMDGPRCNGSTATRLLAGLNCAGGGGGSGDRSGDRSGDDNGDEPPPPPPPQRNRFAAPIFFLDAVLWALVGARARCSPFWRGMGLSLDLSPGQEGGDSGSGGEQAAGDFGAVIDSWVSCHPFSWLGNCVFGRVRPSDSGCARRGCCCAGRRNLAEGTRNNGSNVATTSDSDNKNTATTGPTINGSSSSSSSSSSEEEDPAISSERRRRARVMVRSVGETLVVDPLFLALSAVSRGGWDGSLAGIAGISAVFSALQLLTELRYYVKGASAVLERVPVVLADDDDDGGDGGDGGGGGGRTLSRDEENQHSSVWSASDHSGSSSDDDSDRSSSSSLSSSSISDGRSLETASERVAREC
ncbi:unnamed protein product [Ectocarpus sp. CCAP 1310/34]|nr:unnamed protein product [Ectocarpus sp. CCAP 1310/34]